MKTLDPVIHSLLISVILACLSCGGGANTVAGGGIGGTGITSAGEITAIGSIWVNGVEYDTRQAEVYIDNVSQGIGDQVVVANLDVGRIVCVKGRSSDNLTGTAEKVFYTSTLIGPIDAIEPIDAYTTALTILGQTVILDDRTRLKGTDANAFKLGNLVDVSGLFDGSGNIIATFMAKTADAAPSDMTFVVSGPISGLDPAGLTFFVNDLPVDYSQAVISGFAPEGLENGMFTTISGRFESGGLIFAAGTVRPYQLLVEVRDGDKIEFEGFVFDELSDNQFHINGYLSEINSDTQYVGGTAGEILPGARIKIEGYFSAGMIIVQRIIFSSPLRAESDLGQKNDIDLTLALIGLENMTIRTNSLTRYIGQAGSFEDLALDDHLVIKGHMVGDQTALASQIIGLPGVQDKVVLRAMVIEINDPVLFVNGVRIDTDLLPPNGFYAEDGAVISQEAFFAMVGESDIVSVNGQLLPDDSVAWESVSLVQSQ